jgi:hypothetical protein
MGMIEVMSMAGTSLLMVALPGLLMPFLYIYLIHDYSGRRQGKRDPMLGAKVFTALLMTLCGQLALAGVTFIGVAIVMEGSGEYLTKTGAGLITAGVIVGAYPTFLYFTKVRSPTGANIAHQALGLNALVSGMAFLGGAIVLSQALFHDADLAEPAVVTAIYGSAMAATASLLMKAPLPTATALSDRDR